MSKYFAVFVYCDDNGKIPATTRDPKKGETGKIGLPGGKVDVGETSVEAAYRESVEEGWKFEKIDEDPFYERMVDGKLIGWFVGYNPTKLSEFKEKGRIFPIYSTNDELIKNGYGNDDAVRQYKIRMSLKEHIRKIIRKCLFY